METTLTGAESRQGIPFISAPSPLTGIPPSPPNMLQLTSRHTLDVTGTGDRPVGVLMYLFLRALLKDPNIYPELTSLVPDTLPPGSDSPLFQAVANIIPTRSRAAG